MLKPWLDLGSKILVIGVDKYHHCSSFLCARKARLFLAFSFEMLMNFEKLAELPMNKKKMAERFMTSFVLMIAEKSNCV